LSIEIDDPIGSLPCVRVENNAQVLHIVVIAKVQQLDRDRAGTSATQSKPRWAENSFSLVYPL
jgi:hypothetical protein